MIHDRAFHELSVDELYGMLRLRCEVFVVEQECAYLDVDGRDTEPATRHVWLGTPVEAYLRVLDDGPTRRIGRVVTHPAARSSGRAAVLLEHVLAATPAPWALDAQSHLAGWYARFGFEISGSEYLEDGIAHIPMRREL